MTKRAILYCGQVRQPSIRREVRGKPEKIRGALLPVDDDEIGTDIPRSSATAWSCRSNRVKIQPWHTMIATADSSHITG